MDALMGMFTARIVKPTVETKKDQPMDSITGSCIGGSSSQTESTSSAPTSPRTALSPGGRLLCMDGGGIRGLVLVQMLLEIERISKTPIHHLFDWVAGTSTGGILALGLGCGKTMKQCMCLYIRMKDQAFVGSRPYPS